MKKLIIVLLIVGFFSTCLFAETRINYTVTVGSETNTSTSVNFIPNMPARVEWGIDRISGGYNVGWYETSFSSTSLNIVTSTTPAVGQPYVIDFSSRGYVDKGEYCHKGNVWVLPKVSTITIQGWQVIR